MNLLARLDPGDAVTGLFLIVVLQTSVVILLAALLGVRLVSAACRGAARSLAGGVGIGLDQSGRGRRGPSLRPGALGHRSAASRARGRCGDQRPSHEAGAICPIMAGGGVVYWFRRG